MNFEFLRMDRSNTQEEEEIQSSPSPHQFETIQLQFRNQSKPLIDINALLSLASPDQGGKSLVDYQPSTQNTQQEHSFEDLNVLEARKRASHILENEKRQIFFYQPKYLHPESLQVIAQNLLDEWERELLGLQEEERKSKENTSEGHRLGNQPKE